MAEIQSVSSRFGCLFGYNESLVECHNCGGSMSEPVMLQCLHSCCRSCAEIAGGAAGQQTLSISSAVTCSACGELTEQSAIVPNRLLRHYKHLAALATETVYCSACEAPDVLAAVFWCADCCMGLCESCYSWHNRFHPRHRTAELEIVYSWTLSQLIPAGHCDTHKRQLDVQCFTCRVPKCLLCYDSCRAGAHDWQRLWHEKTTEHVAAMLTGIRAHRERLSCLVSRLPLKCRGVTSRLLGASGEDGLRMLMRHKRSLQDATVHAYDMSVSDLHGNLQMTRLRDSIATVRRSTLCEVATLVAGNIKLISVERLARLHLLRQTLLLKVTVNRCMSTLGASLRRRRKYWQENGAIVVCGSTPFTSDIVLRSCLGATDDRRDAPSEPLLFCQASVTFGTPVGCWDLALTREGLVLLAAGEKGLLVYSSRGRQLSSWTPAKRSNGEHDCVYCLAALSDGRVVVGLGFAMIVVLLKRSEIGDTWLEDRRLAAMQSPPSRLAVHDDLLAAAENRRDEQQKQDWVLGRHVQLLRMSSGQLLYKQSRDYDLWRLALTGLCVVTTNRHPVKLSNGEVSYVIDAFSHSGQFLWRHEISDKEGLAGLCAGETWNCIYFTVLKRDLSSSKVRTISGADGKNERDVMSNFSHGLQLPIQLSLARGQRQTVLAMLNFDTATRQYRTVTLFVVATEDMASIEINKIGR